MPISLHARMMRSAISPRLAINIFLNTQTPHWSSKFKSQIAALRRFDHEERLPVFHGISVLDKDLDDLTGCLGFNLVHELHRLYDTEHLPLFHDITDLGIGRLVR